MRTTVLVSVMVATGFVAAAAVSSIAIAQETNAPARAPARETPRPQDIDPAVDTSAPSVPSARESQASEAAPSASSSAATNAAASGTTPSSTPATASGARPSGAAGATGAAGAAAAGAGAAGAGATGSTGATAQTGAPSQGAAAGAPTAKTTAPSKGKSLDRLELDTTQITGNRELPKVLYIVPWKRSDLGDLVGKPINSLLDEVLTPVDRDVFQRENRYYRALTPGAAENDALSAPDGRPQTPVRNPVPTNSAPAAGSPGSATRSTNAPAGGVSTGSGSATSPPRDEK